MSDLTTKQCTKCRQRKALSQFCKMHTTKDGLNPHCLDCRREYQREYRQRPYAKIAKANEQRRRLKRPKDRERRRAYYREYNKSERMKEYFRQWTRTEKGQTVRKAYNRTSLCKLKMAVKWQKREAIKREVGGTFTVSEWVELCNLADNKCLACGKQIKLTIDHVQPLIRKGCTCIKNIQPLCQSCNSSKHDKTIDYRTDRIHSWLTSITHNH